MDQPTQQQIPVFSRRQNEELIEAIILSDRKAVTGIIDSYFNQIRALHAVDLDEIKNTITYIMSNYAKDCDINRAAKHLYVSAGHLMRQFKQETDKTFLEYLTEYRISLSITLLQSRNYKIYEVGEMVGYGNTKYFRKIFMRITGKSPKDFMN